jgi:hypothetical protein
MNVASAESDSCMAIDDSSVVYRKSGSGAAQLVSSHSGPLSARERQVLILLDGRRTIEELSEFFGAEAIWSLINSLEAKGFAKRVDPDLPPEWANSVTRIQGDWVTDEPSVRGSSSMGTSRWHHDWFALVNLGMLVFVIAMVTGLWAIDRRDSHQVVRIGTAHEQPIDVREGPASSEVADPGGQDHVATAIQPLSHLPAIDGSKSAAGAAPAGDPAPPAPSARRGIHPSDPGSASP